VIKLGFLNRISILTFVGMECQLFVNNDHWHDSRIIYLAVYLCVCAWGGGGDAENDSEPC